MNKKTILMMVALILTSLSSQAAERTLISCSGKYDSFKVIEEKGMLILEAGTWLRAIGGVATSRVQLSFVDKVSQQGMAITAQTSSDLRESGIVEINFVSIPSDDQIKTIQITSDNSFVQKEIVKGLQFDKNNEPIFDVSECQVSK